jgi:hypothetical protein
MLALRSADIAWWHTDKMLGPLEHGQYVLWNWVVSYGYSHISNFLFALFFPALIQLTECEVFGNSTTIISSLRRVQARWRSYLWLAFLLLTTVLILPEALTFGVFFGTGTLEDKLGLLGDSPSIPAIVILVAEIPAGFVLILWAKACLSLSIPSAALEDLAGFKALRRSWDLTRGSRRRIIFAWLAIMVCYWVLALAARYALQLTVYFLYTAAHFHWLGQHLVSEVALILYGTTEAFVAPIYAIAITLLYYDQRVRKEGYDLEKMMEAAGLLAAGQAVAAKVDFADPIVAESGEAQ